MEVSTGGRESSPARTSPVPADPVEVQVTGQLTGLSVSSPARGDRSVLPSLLCPEQMSSLEATPVSDWAASGTTSIWDGVTLRSGTAAVGSLGDVGSLSEEQEERLLEGGTLDHSTDALSGTTSQETTIGTSGSSTPHLHLDVTGEEDKEGEEQE